MSCSPCEWSLFCFHAAAIVNNIYGTSVLGCQPRDTISLCLLMMSRLHTLPLLKYNEFWICPSQIDTSPIKYIENDIIIDVYYIEEMNYKNIVHDK